MQSKYRCSLAWGLRTDIHECWEKSQLVKCLLFEPEALSPDRARTPENSACPRSQRWGRETGGSRSSMTSSPASQWAPGSARHSVSNIRWGSDGEGTQCWFISRRSWLTRTRWGIHLIIKPLISRVFLFLHSMLLFFHFLQAQIDVIHWLSLTPNSQNGRLLIQFDKGAI